MLRRPGMEPPRGMKDSVPLGRIARTIKATGVGYVKAARYGTKFLETIAAWEDHNK